MQLPCMAASLCFGYSTGKMHFFKYTPSSNFFPSLPISFNHINYIKYIHTVLTSGIYLFYFSQENLTMSDTVKEKKTQA
jgi:hypothetical protein